VLALEPLLFFWRALIARTAHIPYDLNTFHSPLAAAVTDALRRGRLPLWEPYAYAGYPLHADVQAQIFYPPAWGAFAFSLWRPYAIHYWLHWLVALQFFIAGVGAYLLLRALGCGRGAALFGATAYELGAFFAAQPQHVGALGAAAWMPFAWLGVFRLAEGVTARRVALLAAALALSLLAGFTAVTLVAYATTAWIALVLAVRRRDWRPAAAVAAAVAFSAVLAAVQLVPTLELSSAAAASQRWRWNDPEGLTPRALGGLFLPDWLHVFTPFDKSKFKENASFPFLYLYHGQAAAWLLLAAVFVRGPARIFASIAALSGLVLFGGQIPGYLKAFHALPKFIRNAAYVEFAQAALSLAVAMAAAMALQRFTRGRERWAVVIALATAVELVLVASGRPMNTGEGGWKRHDSTRQTMRDPGLLARLRAFVQETEPPLRTDVAAWSPRFTSSAALLRLPSANGDNAFAPLRMLAYRGLYTEVTPWTRQYPVKDFGSPLIGASGVGFLLHEGPPDDPRLAGLDWPRVPTGRDELQLYRNPNVLPRYRLVGRTRAAKSQADALELLRGIDVRREAVVEAPLALGSEEPAGSVAVKRYAPERVELEVDAARAALLVAAESYSTGWRAEVDGAPAPLYPANVAFQGVAVAAGRHRVALSYSSASILLWGTVSLLGWMALALSYRRR